MRGKQYKDVAIQYADDVIKDRIIASDDVKEVIRVVHPLYEIIFSVNGGAMLGI